jgi:catechol 2,3-dioxygenase-like lactoylglutathione lyase family enzyme
MGVKFEAINHVALVVRDIEAAERMYAGTLGLRRHDDVNSWFVLNGQSTLHLIEIPEAVNDQSLYQQVQHVAFQVSDLDEVLRVLLADGWKPFQMDDEGRERPVDRPGDPLDFGNGTLFVYDPDGNLLEFLQRGRGMYDEDLRPR